MRTKQNTSVVSLIVIVAGIVILVALVWKGDVKANVKIFGAGFSLETTNRK